MLGAREIIPHKISNNNFYMYLRAYYQANIISNHKNNLLIDKQNTFNKP